MLPARAATRGATLAFAALLILCSACAGPRCVRGKLLRTEHQTLDEAVSCRLAYREEFDRSPPSLVVWVEGQRIVQERVRPVYEQVRVSPVRKWGLHPDFLLWPVNVVRTPLGLAGCAASTASFGLRLGGTALGTAAGALASLPAMPPAYGLQAMGLSRPEATVAFMLVPPLRRAADMVTTPLSVLDIPAALIEHSPLSSLWRGKPSLSRWARSMKTYWRFAWGYESYAPFLVWPKVAEQRREPTGGTVPGDWTAVERVEEPARIVVQSFVLRTSSRTQRMEPTRGQCRIDMLALADGLPDGQAVRFTVLAPSPTGVVSRDFSYKASTIRRAANFPTTP